MVTISDLNFNFSYPKDFYKFGDKPSTYIVDDNEINVWIVQCIQQLETSDMEYTYKASGDSLVMVHRDHDEDSPYQYEVVVSKNYEVHSV